MSDEKSAEKPQEKATERHDDDLVEFGDVTKDTRGHIWGGFFDGGGGYWG